MRSFHPGSSSSALLFAFTAVVLFFTGSILYSQYSEEAIDRVARRIAQDTAPSIQHLIAARAELRALSQLARTELRAGPAEREVEGQELLQAQQLYAEELHLGLSTLPEAQAWRGRMERDRSDLDQALGRLANSLGAGNLAAARGLVEGELRQLTDRATMDILEAIQDAARDSHGLAMRVAAIRHRSLRVALDLSVAGILLTVIMALVALRAVRQFADLQQAHRRIAEERAKELERFADRVAHDIRGPLTPISLALQYAAKRAAGDRSFESIVQRGRTSLDRALRIVSGLLQFAKGGARPEPGAQAQLREVVDDVVGELRAEAREMEVDIEVEPFAPCAVACSPGVLISLVSNLTNNAIKYIGEGPVRRITLRVLDKGTTVQVQVEDTGPGLPAGTQDVFTPYVRGPGATQPGIGLGLATVRRITQAHGGTVGVRSVPHKGCVFWFELPKA